MMLETSDRPNTRRALPVTPARPSIEYTILGSYREMPGLSLHLRQAARLFDVQISTCEFILNDLVRRGSLRRRLDGQYMLSEGGIL